MKEEDKIEEILFDAFNLTHQEIVCAEFDTLASGTTANICLLYGNILVCANVGDSRSVIFLKDTQANTEWKYSYLSFDHKPDIKEERERIEKENGKVECAVGFFKIR